MAIPATLAAHLAPGATTLCRCWALRRADGTEYGFTDHDRDLAFEGLTFRADTGMTAKALQQTTGLSVDNTEAMGALSDASLTEEDILAGRFDGAEVRAWLVNWAEVGERVLQFRGTVGELTRSGGAFRAELRGLTEALNQPQGRVFQQACSAVLGDGHCRFDLGRAGYVHVGPAGRIDEGRVFVFEDLPAFEPRWFERGTLRVLDGRAAGLTAVVKNDRSDGDGRRIEVWEAMLLAPELGDLLRLEAGCDKRAETCRLKFQNFLNFRGFPHIPGEDWLMAYPASSGTNTGGSLRVRG